MNECFIIKFTSHTMKVPLSGELVLVLSLLFLEVCLVLQRLSSFFLVDSLALQLRSFDLELSRNGNFIPCFFTNIHIHTKFLRHVYVIHALFNAG